MATKMNYMGFQDFFWLTGGYTAIPLFIYLANKNLQSTYCIPGPEGTAGTNKNKAPNSRSSHLVTGDTAGEDRKDFQTVREATKETHRVTGPRVQEGRLSGPGS